MLDTTHSFPSSKLSGLLKKKGNQVWFLPPDATVYEAIELMAHKNIGALLVMDSDQLVGIVSERDYARKVILQGKSSRETKIREIMSFPVICVAPDLTSERAMVLMTEKRIRHLPVVADEKVIGVISVGDVIKSLIEDKDFYIQQLTNYIASA